MLALLTLLAGCKTTLPPFKAADQPQAPDYSNEKNWSALPFRKDAADVVAYGEQWVPDSLKQVDVFYVYPTLYSKGDTWNASLDDKKLNKRLDHLPVRLQAGVFSNSARVYAPRYRQAHIDAFEEDTIEGHKALDFAYQDVKRAFEYYMAHYNNGRPIIIAGHSQGSWQTRRLLQEYFDNNEANRKLLVCAYIIGYAMYEENYQNLQPCDHADETTCYVTWGSFKDGYEYPDTANDLLTGNVVVNPITWTMDTQPATTYGTVLLNPAKRKRYTTTAKIHDHYLWVDTHMPIIRHRNTMHVADYNLYWDNIRQNVADRVAAYLKEH